MNTQNTKKNNGYYNLGLGRKNKHSTHTHTPHKDITGIS